MDMIGHLIRHRILSCPQLLHALDIVIGELCVKQPVGIFHRGGEIDVGSLLRDMPNLIALHYIISRLEIPPI